MKPSRRDFLKLSGAALGAGLSPWVTPVARALAAPPERLGRVTTAEAAVRLLPNPDSRLLRTARLDDVFTIYGAVTGAGEFSHNPVWFSVAGGYIYSSWVQPVSRDLNRPLDTIPEAGLWAEVTVPFTDARTGPEAGVEVVYRLYYSAVFQIVGRVTDSAGRAWYKIRDKGGRRFYARANALRPLTASDLSPISPAVKDKRVVIGLNAQRLTAYEGDLSVFQTRVSTGTSWFGVDGQAQDFNTPYGEHRVYSKWIADHMKGDGYDLPGVGWVTYFTESGAGIHAAYWHNDFGRPRSHGCVNTPPGAAKWIFRWTTPDVPYYPGLARGRGDSTLISVQYEP